MFEEGVLNKTGANLSRDYSPLTFCNEWPKVARLLFILFCSCFGTIINGFFVASFFVEYTLRRLGNVFLACIGIADMMITTAVMPVSCVVLLSGQWDNEPVCKLLQVVAETSTYCYSILFALVAIENYYRICRSSAEYEVFLSINLGFISLAIFGVSAILAGVGVYMDLDYDYCEREHYGSFYFRITTIVVFHVIPGILTISCLIAATLQIKRRARQRIHYKRSQLYACEYSIIQMNITVYTFFIIAWIPNLIAVYEFPGTSDSNYYNSVLLALSRSVFTGFLYGIINRNFRHAFAKLFYYCCCKSTLSGSFSNRHRRGLLYKRDLGNVRVHIMHQIANSPQRGASTSRETQNL